MSHSTTFSSVITTNQLVPIKPMDLSKILFRILFNGSCNIVVHTAIKIQAEWSRPSSELYSVNTSTQLSFQCWPRCTVQTFTSSDITRLHEKYDCGCIQGYCKFKPSNLGSSWNLTPVFSSETTLQQAELAIQCHKKNCLSLFRFCNDRIKF